jgi:transcription termination factor NusB
MDTPPPQRTRTSSEIIAASEAEIARELLRSPSGSYKLKSPDVRRAVAEAVENAKKFLDENQPRLS